MSFNAGSSPLLPGQATIGILGGGQLGRMLALAGRRMGYRFVVLCPEKDCPAAPVCDQHICKSYEDEKALKALAKAADVITLEFENIPVKSLEFLAQTVPVRPASRVLGICQNREAEKRFLRRKGYPLPGFRVVTEAAELVEALRELGPACVLKTARWGYDGKGQRQFDSSDDVEEIWKTFGEDRGVVEQYVDYTHELSVICARTPRGEKMCFPVVENIHSRHILDITIAPGRIPSKSVLEATELAMNLADDLEMEGLLAVELFLRRDGSLAINELAPRPHNSGHFSFDVCETSQFEQAIRAVCDLPLGSPTLMKPAAMVNILGDVWAAQKGDPDWVQLLEDPNVHLHLYGKTEPQARRKMGHFTVTGENADEVLATAQRLKVMLEKGG